MPVNIFGESKKPAPAGAVVRMSTVGLVHKAGDTMLVALSMGGFLLANVGDPTKAIPTPSTRTTCNSPGAR